jgi:endogenous inhibitor of DNA gyrase (YacG/DUF329 family)
MSEKVPRCPICERNVDPGDPEFPFCSRRCRTQDLANWANEAYRVPVKPDDDQDGS